MMLIFRKISPFTLLTLKVTLYGSELQHLLYKYRFKVQQRKSPRKSKNQNPLKLAYKTAEVLLAQNIACSSHNICKVSCTFFLSLGFSVSSSYLQFNFLFWI